MPLQLSLDEKTTTKKAYYNLLIHALKTSGSLSSFIGNACLLRITLQITVFGSMTSSCHAVLAFPAESNLSGL